jgi:hypothetical protein
LNIVDTVWIRALADGERVFEAIFQPGQTKSIEAKDSVRLFVGNAGGVQVALNGKQLPPIGPLGRVQRVLLTPSGMELLPPPAVSGEETVGSNSSREPSTLATMKRTQP